MTTRREFLHRTTQSALALSLASPLLAGAAHKKEEIIYPKGKAEHCIFIWLGGGAAHVDTWAIKRKGDGKKVAGSASAAVATTPPGVKVSEHLATCAKILDRFVLVRTANHTVIDEHAAATN